MSGIDSFINETVGTEISTDKRPYIKPGTHELKVDKVFFQESRNPKKKNTTYANVYFTVIGSSDPTVAPGSELCMIIDTNHIMATQNIKSFLVAAIGLENSSGLTADMMKKAFGDDNPLAGAKVKCIAVTSQSKAGNPFVKLAWRKS